MASRWSYVVIVPSLVERLKAKLLSIDALSRARVLSSVWVANIHRQKKAACSEPS